ncbi:MAG: CoA-binding protein [Actinobacteria bacterium]|nr:CoA-binding protein [Actinomycetota bacterium]MBU1945302.1 CoA-binding protein [Actinomycetota bacterium]MBU2686502.1 CoA-binding protein [Actinomycetota bacterium]
MLDLRPVFEPERVAVVGVSLSNPFHPANIIYNKNYYGHDAEAFAVNPRGGTLERRPVFESVSAIPGGVDMAVLAVKAPLVPGVAEEAANAGARALVVIGGGFAETGPEGRVLQEELLAVCRKHDVALIGPNCFGVYSPPRVDTFFLPPERTVLPTKGDIAVASQSGAFLVDQVMTNFQAARIGVSVAVSMGNKAMVDEVVLLEHFARRDDTHAICFYLEGTDERMRSFMEVARDVTRAKPVVVYVGGKSERGAQAAASHTAALAGNHELMAGALKQSGVLEAETELEVTSFCKMLSYYHERPLSACNIAVISSSGGHGVIASDLCEPAGLNIPRFSEERQEELRALLEPNLHEIASLGNPVDLTGSASDQDFERTLDYLLSQNDIEAAMILTLPYTPMMTSFVGTRLGQVVKRHEKPVVAYVPDLAKYGMVLEGFELNGIPVVHAIEHAVQMLKCLRLLGETTCGG